MTEHHLTTISLQARLFEASGSSAYRRMYLKRQDEAGRPGGIRTPDPRFRKPLLYPSELQAHA